MFTGIIEHLGKIKQVSLQANSAIIVVDIGSLKDGVIPGDSIAINGACLTVTQIKGTEVYFDVSRETLSKTNIGKLNVSDRVNIERSLKIGDKLGGHFVTGHVDCVGTINKIANETGQCTVWICVSNETTSMMIKKGSVAIDGISLTIVDLKEKLFSVALIPFTLDATTLGFKKAGQKVNIETDMLGKWVKRILTTNDTSSSEISEEMLKEKGFM
ncbi:riboflavin synthase alpha chain [Candidatus Scalindua japonica]|uniref:Riboflavin synthase n=1 Tax=Candidatus Scalindua japonica TaxID=1284222 RepID=A0A286TWQ1_9BACT|nr:riboflavin synthase [Candidatus Scalindua japonica]GAX60302.1 riboflavin synthase alpha chain [Candidatus Scalindua japonica]